jgi:aspartate/tyrosine/aromatic aminotransferase
MRRVVQIQASHQKPSPTGSTFVRLAHQNQAVAMIQGPSGMFSHLQQSSGMFSYLQQSSGMFSYLQESSGICSYLQEPAKSFSNLQRNQAI